MTLIRAQHQASELIWLQLLLALLITSECFLLWRVKMYTVGKKRRRKKSLFFFSPLVGWGSEKVVYGWDVVWKNLIYAFIWQSKNQLLDLSALMVWGLTVQELRSYITASSVLSPAVASSSADHDLHSNWVLRVPRVADDSEQKAVPDCAKESARRKKNQSGSTSSRLRLQRNPIHLPKVVESAFQTLRFKPKLKKQWSLLDIWNLHRHGTGQTPCPADDPSGH